VKVKIHHTWNKELQDIFLKDSFNDLASKVKEEYANHRIYPSAKNIFRAFNLCPFDKIKVVILGQDPYHGENQANGLSFSVNKGILIPPSLKNIYKELSNNFQDFNFQDGDLSPWATQGVLLINSILTVRRGKPGSHQGIGWQDFTDEVIKIISKRKKNIVFLLWGSFAKSKVVLINNKKEHLILSSSHPSPFSAHKGFFGNNHFKKANEYLRNKSIVEINW
tara:strand:+ start:3432 stop:4097 length:666 start_codon:yes stop_codon:yes gene_type:complete